MRTKIALLILFFLSTEVLISQSNFQRGYIVKATGDTIFGQLDYRSISALSKACIFRLNDQTEAIPYTPNDLSSFHFDNGKELFAKSINGNRYFMELRYDGCVQLFTLREKINEERIFIEKKGLELTEIKYSEEKISRRGRTYLQPSTQHIGVLKLFMQEQPSLYPRIEGILKPDLVSLVQLAKQYQLKACKDQVIAPQKKQPAAIKVALEAVMGMVKYREFDFFIDKNYFQTGVLVHIWAPRTTENVLLRTGVLYSNVQQEAQSGLFKFPILVEYINPSGAIRPRFAAGVNLYNPFYQSMALGTGFNIKLQETWFIACHYDVDFEPIKGTLLLPKRSLSNSLSIGVFYKL